MPLPLKPSDLADISTLPRNEWCAAFDDTAEETGYFEQLGAHHAVAFIDPNDPLQGDEDDTTTTLLVSFDSYERAIEMTPNGYPMGFNLALEKGWAHLSLVAHDGAPPALWFRAQAVYTYFDRLIEDGFFDAYDKVVFYGAGPAGYAASAFSVAAPGATVIAISPQATLDGRLASWDTRFAQTKRLDFQSRYGFAPHMIDAAAEMWLFYTPEDDLDAMHASMFNAPHVNRFPVRHMGSDLEYALSELRALPDMISFAMADGLSTQRAASLLRTRRKHPPYLRRLLARVEQRGRPALTAQLAQYVLQSHGKAPLFRKALKRANAQLAEE